VLHEFLTTHKAELIERCRHKVAKRLTPKVTEVELAYVIAVGNGQILDSGEIRPLEIKVRDKVLFGKYSGTEVKLNGEDLLVMKEDDIMAVIESDAK
jgi:co-chaperonin GroES (HSP10)